MSRLILYVLVPRYSLHELRQLLKDSFPGASSITPSLFDINTSLSTEAHMLGASIKKNVHRGQKRQELKISLSLPVRKSALDDNKDVVCLQLNQQDVC